MKAKGSEIIEFWQAWPMGEHWWIEDYEINVEDDTGIILDPSKTYDLDSFGVLVYQGPAASGPDEPRVSFETEFKKWKKTRNRTDFIVSVPNEFAVSFRCWLEQQEEYKLKILSPRKWSREK